MKPLAKQRRDALLIAPENVIVVTDRRGRLWVSDRFTLARGDLFEQPPTKNSGVFLDVEDERAKRGVVKTRALLRSINWDDTTWLTRDDGLSSAVGDDGVAWFKVGSRPIYTSAHRRVSDGYRSAGLVPRLHIEQGFITWWRPTNSTQHALAAVLMPRLAMPAPRNGATS